MTLSLSDLSNECLRLGPRPRLNFGLTGPTLWPDPRRLTGFLYGMDIVVEYISYRPLSIHFRPVETSTFLTRTEEPVKGLLPYHPPEVEEGGRRRGDEILWLTLKSKVQQEGSTEWGDWLPSVDEGSGDGECEDSWWGSSRRKEGPMWYSLYSLTGCIREEDYEQFPSENNLRESRSPTST